MTDRKTGWVVEWVIDQLTERLADWMADFLIGWLNIWQTAWFIDWPTGWCDGKILSQSYLILGQYIWWLFGNITIRLSALARILQGIQICHVHGCTETTLCFRWFRDKQVRLDLVFSCYCKRASEAFPDQGMTKVNGLAGEVISHVDDSMTTFLDLRLGLIRRNTKPPLLQRGIWPSTFICSHSTLALECDILSPQFQFPSSRERKSQFWSLLDKQTTRWNEEAIRSCVQRWLHSRLTFT